MTRPVPQVLIPWIPAEAITCAQAAVIANRAHRTVQLWAAQHDLGRRVGGCHWRVSKPALLMWLESDRRALAAYLSGDRDSDLVRGYFRQAGVPLSKQISEISAKPAVSAKAA